MCVFSSHLLGRLSTFPVLTFRRGILRVFSVCVQRDVSARDIQEGGELRHGFEFFETEKRPVLTCCFWGLSCRVVLGQVMDKLGWTKKKGELLLALGRHEEAEELYRQAVVVGI